VVRRAVPNVRAAIAREILRRLPYYTASDALRGRSPPRPKPRSPTICFRRFVLGMGRVARIVPLAVEISRGGLVPPASADRAGTVVLEPAPPLTDVRP